MHEAPYRLKSKIGTHVGVSSTCAVLGTAARLQIGLKDHKIAFERAATVFLDPQALSEFDEDHSEDEDRWLTLGVDRTGTLW